MYNLIVRPLLFLIDPEKVHRMLLNWLKIYRYLLPVRACVEDTIKWTNLFHTEACDSKTG